MKRILTTIQEKANNILLFTILQIQQLLMLLYHQLQELCNYIL